MGANVGINLHGLRRLLGAKVMLSALEPNPDACGHLLGDKDLGLTAVMQGNAYEIPQSDEAHDLVFTNGVLIHVPPVRLTEALREIMRVSKSHVLCSEYFSHIPAEAPYQGRGGLLWKRDFGRAYLEACPTLEVIEYGFPWQQESTHFDNLNWWLFKKSR